MPREAEAQGWWSDPELERLRERIEHRRALQASDATPHRGVREVRGNARLTLVRREDPVAPEPDRKRLRPRPAAQRLGPRPDRIAALAVVLGLLLLFAAIISAHG